jgi:hypothetical protein
MSKAIDKLIETASAIVAETPEEGSTTLRPSGTYPSSSIRRALIVDLQNVLAQLGPRFNARGVMSQFGCGDFRARMVATISLRASSRLRLGVDV